MEGTHSWAKPRAHLEGLSIKDGAEHREVVTRALSSWQALVEVHHKLLSNMRVPKLGAIL